MTWTAENFLPSFCVRKEHAAAHTSEQIKSQIRTILYNTSRGHGVTAAAGSGDPTQADKDAEFKKQVVQALDLQ